jgi:hypothetical protein
VVFAVREFFSEAGLLTVALRAGRALLAAGLFAALFFLVGFAIAGNRQRRENGRLIKNISRISQADSVKKFTAPRNASMPRKSD